jgi:hypothetical protein
MKNRVDREAWRQTVVHFAMAADPSASRFWARFAKGPTWATSRVDAIIHFSHGCEYCIPDGLYDRMKRNVNVTVAKSHGVLQCTQSSAFGYTCVSALPFLLLFFE